MVDANIPFKIPANIAPLARTTRQNYRFQELNAHGLIHTLSKLCADFFLKIAPALIVGKSFSSLYSVSFLLQQFRIFKLPTTSIFENWYII